MKRRLAAARPTAARRRQAAETAQERHAALGEYLMQAAQDIIDTHCLGCQACQRRAKDVARAFLALADEPTASARSAAPDGR